MEATAAKATNGETKASESGGVRYSIKEAENGTKYVSVDVDQARFDGLTPTQMQAEAKKVIMEKFAGKVIGESNRAYVNGTTAGEYSHPANRNLNDTVKEAKMRSSAELDNLLEVSQFLRHEDDDGRHPQAVGGWDKYQTTFEVGGRKYTGEISIENTTRGRLFYDVTKIRDVTESPPLSTGNTSMTASIGNASVNTISKTTEDVKTRHSQFMVPLCNTASA